MAGRRETSDTQIAGHERTLMLERRWNVAHPDRPTNEQIVKLLETVLRELSKLEVEVAKLTKAA